MAQVRHAIPASLRSAPLSLPASSTSPLPIRFNTQTPGRRWSPRAARSLFLVILVVHVDRPDPRLVHVPRGDLPRGLARGQHGVVLVVVAVHAVAPGQEQV